MNDNIARFILRVAVGGMLILHGINKVIHGLGSIEGMLAAHGLPGILAYGVYVGEVLAPIFLIIGWRSRFWAGVIAFNMAVAIYLSHLGGLGTLNAHGGWTVELPMFFLLSSVVIMLLGSGKYAIVRD